jgi:hypothetical protein
MGGAKPSNDGSKIGLLGMVTVGFFWVHGGIYGTLRVQHLAPSPCQLGAWGARA